MGYIIIFALIGMLIYLAVQQNKLKTIYPQYKKSKNYSESMGNVVYGYSIDNWMWLVGYWRVLFGSSYLISFEDNKILFSKLNNFNQLQNFDQVIDIKDVSLITFEPKTFIKGMLQPNSFLLTIYLKNGNPTQEFWIRRFPKQTDLLSISKKLSSYKQQEMEQIKEDRKSDKAKENSEENIQPVNQSFDFSNLPKSKPWYKKWWIWVLIVLGCFTVIAASNSSDDSSSDDNKTEQSSNKTNTTKSEESKSAPAENKDESKKDSGYNDDEANQNAQNWNYGKLVKSDDYSGKSFKLDNVTVMQADEGDGETTLLVYSGDDSDKLYMVKIKGKTDAVEDDTVNVKGILTDRTNYDTKIGGSNTVPTIEANEVKVTGHNNDD